MPGYYHLSVQIIGRATGRSAVACAAYRSGQSLYDERYGKLHDYAPRKGITETGIRVPDGGSDWMHDRQELWNRVEKAERRKDAQLAREIELGLPHQMTHEQRKELVETFIEEQLLPRGMIVDYAIHAPSRAGDERNFHAHLMTTLRPIMEGELSALKDREACAPEMIAQWREAWAEIQNRMFERNGICSEDGQMLRVDHRSYEQQGIDQEPTVHMGVLATAMERKGKPTELGDLNRAITTANDNRRLMRRNASRLNLAEINRQLDDRKRGHRGIDNDGPEL